MKKQTLIIGSNGFIGKHLVKALKPKYCASRKNAPNIFDLSKPNLNNIPLKEISHGIIAAACANIPYCEKNPQETFQINVTGTLNLLKEFVAHEVFPIIFSSDYVFDGIEGNYTETSPLSPINEYGRHKAEVEKQIDRITGGNHLILRLSKIYSLKRRDRTFLDEMANHLEKAIPMPIATDQVFCPLAIEDLVIILQMLIKKGSAGLYNLGGINKLTRLDLAKEVALALNLSTEKIVPIKLNDLDPSFSRPLNTSLSSAKVYSLLNYTPLSIKNAIRSQLNGSR